jgi:hypothetical protein
MPSKLLFPQEAFSKEKPAEKGCSIIEIMVEK